ncbi:MAG TPA: SMP-30/gluconolactonase/LRE family protein [Actinomycetota bacterium]|nr:SMP-30/gluconolactonase/LRE family protein [Actinomycetota bacterium]
MTRELRAELVVDAKARLGEGPLWDHRDRVLWWLDVEGQRIHRLDPSSGESTSLQVATKVSALALRRAGGLVAAVADGFAAVGADGSLEQLASVQHADPEGRMNDGKCDSSGRFWAGSMSMSGPLGVLYRLDPGGAVRTMLSDVSISNGMAWAADDKTMYYIDTLAGGVDAFDFDAASGDISARRRFIEIPDPAYPDGMAIDDEGFLWVALWGGWAVNRYSPGGDLDCTVRVPAAHVTSCAFGGDDLDVLYVTTASMGLATEARGAQRLAGGLFALRPGVRGVASNAFAG